MEKVKVTRIYFFIYLIFMIYMTIGYSIFCYLIFHYNKEIDAIITVIISIFFGSATKDFFEFILKSVDSNLEIKSVMSKKIKVFFDGGISVLQIFTSLAFVCTLAFNKYNINISTLSAIGLILFGFSILLLFLCGVSNTSEKK